MANTKPYDTKPQSSPATAAIKSGLIKSKLESTRSRTSDGTPISYTSIKEGFTNQLNNKNPRNSRSFSDPDISQSLVIFTEANGLFSQGKNLSTFTGKNELKVNNVLTNKPVFNSSECIFKKGSSLASVESLSTDFEVKHHMTEFANPLHKGNQPRFRKGGGVKPDKPALPVKPVIAPKPPSNEENKGSYKEVNEADSIESHKKLTIPKRPPPRKQALKATNANNLPKTLNTCDYTVQVCENEELLQEHNIDVSKQNHSHETEPTLYENTTALKNTNRSSRSDSDPSPSNISIASKLKYELVDKDSAYNTKYVLESENEDEVEDFDEGWDSDEFDDQDEENEEESKTQEICMHFPDQRSKKLYNIAFEILTTEQAYVKRLYLLDKVFYFRLQNECFAHGHIPADVLPDIFSNISSIYSFHKDFLLPKLEERMAKWATDNRIGDILKTLAPFLKLYTAYIANFDQSNETLSLWMKKSQKFASIVEDIQKSKDCENLTLGHHMLEPIQRVPRYKLLLKDYLSKLPEDSPDYKDTQDAMGIISEAAAHANESMKKTERFKKLLELQERIIEDYDLITAGRQFLREGDLTKVAARQVAHQERTLLLFNDVLLCCGKLPGTNKLKVKVEMDLYGMEIGETDDDDVKVANTFRVTSKQKVIDFSTSSEQDKLSWIQSLNEAIIEISYKKDSYKRGTQPNSIKDSELGKKAPVWVRDVAVTMCMLCDALFTLTRRRHHCRACGGIFCNPCSRGKAELEYSGKTERICDNCHKILVHGQNASFVKRTVDDVRHHDVRKISRDSKVLLSGYLNYKIGKSGDKSWDKRWCVLSNTFEFYCYKAKKDQKAQFSLPLPGYIVDKPNLADNIDKKIAFKLHHKNVVVYYFSADSQELLDRWIHNLSFAVKAERIPEDS